jgi:hypothetical protein
MAKRVDANQRQIVRELRQVPGVSVQHLHTIGKGCPDILVALRGQTFGPYEIKVPGGTLTADEVTWWSTWTGGGKVVYCTEDVLRDMHILKEATT